MAITTTQKVKDFFGILDTSSDVKIDVLIPLVESDYQKIQGRRFSIDEDGATIYPEASEATALMMIGYHLNKKLGLKTENLADLSQTFEDPVIMGYPASIVASITKKMSW